MTRPVSTRYVLTVVLCACLACAEAPDLDLSDPEIDHVTLEYRTEAAGFGHLVLGAVATGPPRTSLTCSGALNAAGTLGIQDSVLVAEESEGRVARVACTARYGRWTATATAATVVPGVGGAPGNIVSPQGLDGKVLYGYQGWFGCPGDGSLRNKWVRWFRAKPVASDLVVDMWADASELDESERCPADIRLPGGPAAATFSSYRRTTVMRHFKWMNDYGLDGVFLQRFICCVKRPNSFEASNHVAENVRAGAEAYGRVYALMYDLSLQPDSAVVPAIIADWAYLVDTLRLTESPRYVREGGVPVIGLWGLGFAGRDLAPARGQALLDYFHRLAPARMRAYVVAGVPTGWRTLSGDASGDSAWTAVYRAADVISPWSVNRYRDEGGADAYAGAVWGPDAAETARLGIGYLPVVFPGFSRRNDNGEPLNGAPRNGGRLFWRQVYDAKSLGAGMLYVAMFDEINEGTAMFKLAPTAAMSPAGVPMVPLDADGYPLPSDWYLRLAGKATALFRGEMPLSAAMPLELPARR